MALTKEIKTTAIEVREDGQLTLHDMVTILEDDVQITSYVEMRNVDVGEDIAAESDLVKDTAKNLHTPARKTARDVVKAAEESRKRDF